MIHEPTTPRGERAFTLLELLAVIGLLSVLMGLGIGFLRRGDGELATAVNSLRAVFREAANTARSAGLPAHVVLRSRGINPHEAYSMGLTPVGAWRLDAVPLKRPLMPDLVPLVQGEVVPQGRFGEARRGDEQRPAWQLEASSGRFSMRNGFGVRFHMKLDEIANCTILRLGPGLLLRLDPEGRLDARIMLQDGGGGRGLVQRGVSARGVPFGRWVQLEALHDTRRFQVFLDGVRIIDLEAEGSWYREAGDPFVLSPSNDPVPGAFDELELLAYARGQSVLLPDGVAFGLQPKGPGGKPGRPLTGPQSDEEPTMRIDLDRNGDPSAGTRVRLEVYDAGEETSEDVFVEIQPGGLLLVEKAAVTAKPGAGKQEGQ